MEHVNQYLTKIYTPDLDDASGIKELIKLPIPSWLIQQQVSFIYTDKRKKDRIIHRPLVARASMEEDIAATWEFFMAMVRLPK